MEQLYSKLANANLIDEAGNIILERYEDGSVQSVDKPTFEVLFGDVADNPTYDRLSGSHTFMWGDPPAQQTYTATQMGYQKYFDEWKAAGILM